MPLFNWEEARKVKEKLGSESEDEDYELVDEYYEDDKSSKTSFQSFRSMETNGNGNLNLQRTQRNHQNLPTIIEEIPLSANNQSQNNNENLGRNLLMGCKNLNCNCLEFENCNSNQSVGNTSETSKRVFGCLNINSNQSAGNASGTSNRVFGSLNESAAQGRISRGLASNRTNIMDLQEF